MGLKTALTFCPDGPTRCSKKAQATRPRPLKDSTDLIFGRAGPTPFKNFKTIVKNRYHIIEKHF